MDDLVVTVVGQLSVCPAGHKVGDVFLFSGDRASAGLCPAALAALSPTISMLASGLNFPWEDDPDAIRRVCYGCRNPLIFEIRRRQATGQC